MSEAPSSGEAGAATRGEPAAKPAVTTRGLSMRARLNWLVACTIAPIMVLVLFWTMHEMRTEDELGQELVLSESNNLRMQLDQHYRHLEHVANALVVLAGDSPRKVSQAELARLMQLQPDYVSNLALFDADGRLIAAYRDPNGRLAKEGDGNTPYLRTPRETDAMVSSEPLVSRVDGSRVVISSRRIVDAQGRLLGVAALATNVDRFKSALEANVRIAGLKVALLMGDPGKIQPQERIDWPAQGLPDNAQQWLVVDWPVVTGKAQKVRVALRAEHAPWVLVINVPRASLVGEHSAHAASFALAGLLALIIGLFFGARLVSQHTVEVDRLRSLVDHFSGDTAQPSPPLGLPGDLGLLEAAFAKLQKRLIGKREELEQEREFYRKLSHSAVDWTWEQDANLRFTRITSIGQHFLRATHESVIGKYRWDQEYVNMTPELWEEHKAVLRARQPFRNLILQQRDAEGTLRSVRVSGDPVFDSAGKFTGYRGTGVDITQAFDVNYAVAQAEHRWLAALEGAGHGVWDWDLRTNRIFRSRYWLEMFGLPPDAQTDDPALWDELVHPDDIAQSADPFWAHVKGETPQYVAEYRMRHSSGSYRWVLDRGRAIEFMPDGTAARVVGTQTDITELKELALRLKESESRRETIFRKSAMPTAVLDAGNGQFMDVNDAFVSHFGWSREEAIGRRASDLGLWVDLADRERLAAGLKAESSLRNFETCMRTREGVVLDFVLHVDMIDIGGRTALLSQAINVTETVAARRSLELAERWSRKLINSSPARFMVTRMDDGRIVDLNNKACADLCVKRADAVGKTAVELGLWLDPAEREKVTDVLLRQGKVSGFQCLQRHGDGSIRHTLIYAEVVEQAGEKFVLGQAVDITELAETQRALRESEQQLLTVFRHSALPMLIFDAETNNILSVNQAFLNMVQADEESIVGTQLIDHGLWANPAEREAMYHELRTVGKVHGMDVTLSLQDGSQARLQTYIDRIQLGGRTAFVAQALDVTQERKARAAMEQANKWARTLLQTSPTAMVLMRAETGEIVDMNEQACRLFGYSRNELLGQTTKTLHNWVDEAERLALAETFKRDGRITAYPARQRTRSGEIRHVLAFAEQVSLDGEDFILGQSIDISDLVRTQEALKASEQRMKAILERSPNVAIQGFDDEGRIRLWNSASEGIFGWPADAVLGRRLDELTLSEAQAREFEAALSRMAGQQTVIGPVEMEAHAQDGRHLTLLSTVFEIPASEDGTRFICMAVDITERKQQEQLIRESESSLDAVLQQAALPMLILDGATLNVARINAAFERMFGLDSNVLVGRMLNEFNVWEDPAQRVAMLSELSKSGHIEGMEARMMAPDGRRFVLLIFVDTIVLSGRKMYVAQGLDITEEKRARREQEDATKLARLVLENSPTVMVFTRESDRTITEINDVACQYYGYTREEMMGRSSIALNLWADQRERERARDHFIAHGELSAFPVTVRSRTGELKRCLLYWRRVMWQGESHILGQSVDITELARVQQELAESEQRMHSVFEHSPVPMVIVSSDPQRISQVNPALADLLGIRPEEAVGKSTIELGLWGDQFERERLMAALKERGQVKGMEFKIRAKDGSLRDFLIFVDLIPYGGSYAIIGQGIDVTDTNRAIREAERSRKWFRALFERSPISMTLIRASDGRIVMANEANHRTYGVDANALIGKTSLEVRTWQDESEAKRIMAQLMRDGSLHGVVTQRRKPDGSLAEVMIYADALQLDDEHYFITQGIDVTEAQASQRALRAVTALNSAAFNAVGEAIVVHGAEGRVVLVNSAAESMFGLPSDALLGSELKTDTLAWLRPDESHLPDDELPFVEVLHTRQPVRERVIGLMRARPRWFSVSCEPIDPDDDGVSEGTVTSFFDITDRVMAEAELRVLLDRLQLQLERMPISCFLTDADYNIIYWNPASQRMFGYTTQEMLGHSIDMLTQPNLREAVRGLIAKSYESRSGIDFGTENLTKAGKRLICEWRSNVLYGADGEFVAVMHMAIDMTEVIESQKRLTRVNEELEARVAQRTAQLSASVRELELFSYTVAHDLRAPLRALDGYAYLLAEGGPNAGNFLARIRSNVAHMSSLIDGLLHYGRLGRQAINRQMINMPRLVEVVVQDLRQSYPGVTFEVGELKAVPGDESMIRQVWTNLIGNACKFSAQGERPLVRVWSEPGQEGRQRFYVKDNGVGFDMAYSNRLFGVFERLHKQNEFSGSGIGLSIVKRVVERHEGTVGVESSPNEGATFWFELPIVATDSPAS